MTLTVGRLASEQIEARVNRFVILVRRKSFFFESFIFLVNPRSCHVDPQLILVSRRCRDCLLSVFSFSCFKSNFKHCFLSSCFHAALCLFNYSIISYISRKNECTAEPCVFDFYFYDDLVMTETVTSFHEWIYQRHLLFLPFRQWSLFASWLS